MFSHSVGCLFILLMISFAVQEFLVWYSPTCLFFSFVSFAWGDISYIILLWTMFEILLPMSSSTIFMVLSLTLKSLIHFKFILIYGVRRWSSIIFPHVSVQFSQHYFWVNYLQPIVCACFLCQILIDSKGIGLFPGSLFCFIDLCICFMPVPCCFDYHGLIV